MTGEDHQQPVVLSRDELYSQIWATPMIRLAAQYGITGTGLAKICARLNVPWPPRGYRLCWNEDLPKPPGTGEVKCRLLHFSDGSYSPLRVWLGFPRWSRRSPLPTRR